MKLKIIQDLQWPAAPDIGQPKNVSRLNMYLIINDIRD